MEHLIQFRMSADLLSQNEYESLVECIDKNDMFEALFYYHLKQLENNDCTKIQRINNKISEILNARDTLDNSEITPLPSPQFDNIPRSLLNYIDAFLPNNINFQRVNRKAYIASKSPPHIHKIDPKQIHKYVKHCNKNRLLIDTNKFKTVQHLQLDNKAIKLWNNHRFIANNVNKLRISDDEIGQQLTASTNTINLQQIHHLEFASIYFPSNILQQTPNLQYLNLDEVEIKSDTIISNNIMQKLKGLNVMDCSGKDSTIIINLCGVQLQSLGIWDYDICDPILSNVNFKRFVNITELTMAISKKK
eukprot:510742_1